MARVKEAAAEAAHAVADGVADGAAAVVAAADAATTPSARVAESLSASTGKSGALSPRRAARLPGPARFVLAVVLSFALSELGRSFVNHYSNNEVGSIAREITSQKELAALAAWKLFGLALGWFGGYDGFDLAALALLSHGPTTFLTSVFYGIRAVTAGAYLAVEVASASLPFLLLRGLSGAHSAARGTPNRDIVADRSIQVLTSLQAALAYSVVLFLAGRYLLPTNLVLYFQGIPTVQPAADATFLGFGGGSDPATITSQLLSLVCGLAARSFIFTPLVTTPQQTDEDQKNAAFDPVHATLAQTVKWNLWGYTTRTKVSLARTGVAMLFSAVGTYLDTAVGIAGVEPQGAVVYAGVWVAAALVTGLSLRYVGSI